MNNVAVYDPTAQPAVSFTAAALTHIKKEIKKHQALGLRLGVKKAGCSGYKYVIDYVHKAEPSDRVISIEDDLTVYIDATVLPKVYGVKIDYIREGLNGSIKFDNPNASAQCGCGESFAD
jgi:iron-sulfur cluster assembly accessory protein